MSSHFAISRAGLCPPAPSVFGRVGGDAVAEGGAGGGSGQTSIPPTPACHMPLTSLSSRIRTVLGDLNKQPRPGAEGRADFQAEMEGRLGWKEGVGLAKGCLVQELDLVRPAPGL